MMWYLSFVVVVLLAVLFFQAGHVKGLQCNECIGAAGREGAAYEEIAITAGLLKYPVWDNCNAGNKSNRTVECPDDYFCGKDYFTFGYGDASMTIRGCTRFSQGETMNTCSLDYNRAYLVRLNGEEKDVNPLRALKKLEQNGNQSKGPIEGWKTYSCICNGDDCNRGVGSEVYQPVSNLATGLVQRMLNQM